MKIRVIFMSLLLAVSAFADSRSLDRSDSGIHGPKYSEILGQMEKLQSEHDELVQLIDYGKSVRGKTLRMMVVMKKGKFVVDRPALIMSGSTHGDEYLNIEDRLPQALVALADQAGSVASFLDEGGALVFIPILNPDGYDSRSRENANGVDLNRDWDVPPANFKGFKEVETKLLANKLEALTMPPYNFRYKVSVDYHCCAGALLYPWAYTNKALPEADETKHVVIGELAAKHLDIEYGTTGKILGYYPTGTTKDYYYDKYGTLSFTYEGRYGKENKNFDQHVAWWEDMIGTLSMSHRRPLFSMIRKGLHPFIKIAD